MTFFQTRGISRFNCRECDFDVCDVCFEFHRYAGTVFGPNFLQEGGSDATDHPSEPPSAPSSSDPATLSADPNHVHVFVKTKTSEVYSGQGGVRWVCDSCSKRGGDEGGRVDAYVFHCVVCDYYDLCRDCYEEKADIRCPDGHRLMRRDPPQNGWSCDGDDGPEDGCLRPENGIYGEFRYRCNDCDFDLCWLCFETKANKNINGGLSIFFV